MVMTFSWASSNKELSYRLLHHKCVLLYLHLSLYFNCATVLYLLSLIFPLLLGYQRAAVTATSGRRRRYFPRKEAAEWDKRGAKAKWTCFDSLFARFHSNLHVYK